MANAEDTFISNKAYFRPAAETKSKYGVYRIENLEGAKKKVEEHIQKARQAGTDDLMVGSALEEAITIDQQEERIERMMKKVGDYYSRKGQTHRWVKIKKEAVKIEKKREVKRKQKAAAEKAEDALVRDLAVMFAWLVGTVIFIFGAVFLIFGLGPA